jgi:hypothetical protein
MKDILRLRFVPDAQMRDGASTEIVRAHKDQHIADASPEASAILLVTVSFDSACGIKAI